MAARGNGDTCTVARQAARHVDDGVLTTKLVKGRLGKVTSKRESSIWREV